MKQLMKQGVVSVKVTVANRYIRSEPDVYIGANLIPRCTVRNRAAIYFCLSLIAHWSDGNVVWCPIDGCCQELANITRLNSSEDILYVDFESLGVGILNQVLIFRVRRIQDPRTVNGNIL